MSQRGQIGLVIIGYNRDENKHEFESQFLGIKKIHLKSN